MSYQDVARGAGRELRPYSPTGAVDKAVKDAVSATFKIQTEVARLRHDADKLGSAQDTVELRQRLGASNIRITSLARDVKDRLVKLSALPGVNAKQASKLTTDFETILKEFQMIMKAARSKEAASLPRQTAQQSLVESGALHSSEALESRARQQQQAQHELKQVDVQIEHQQALIEERDQGIQEIQQQIAEVGEIFQDLAVLIHDQGTMLDDIESNIGIMAQRTADAHTEVAKADTYQRKGRNRRCWLLLIAGLVLGLLLVILLS